MGTISSSTGLISGLDIESLVSQLIAIEGRPLDQLTERIAEAREQQTAYLELSARLIAAKSAVHGLTMSTAFDVKAATSTNESVMTASAGSETPTGSYSFVVKSLVTTHQLVSSGFADRDSTPVGAGTLNFAVGNGFVNEPTPLSALNGFSGVGGGQIRITDRTGESATVDLRGVTELQEVLDVINAQPGLSVRAYVDGDQLVVEDQTGLTSGNLAITDIGSGRAAANLGIAGTHTDGEARSHDLLYLTEDTRLSFLNDGNGVRVNGLSADLEFQLRDGRTLEANFSGNLRFDMRLDELNSGDGVRGDDTGQRVIRVTDRSGTSAEIDLSSAETVQDVIDAFKASDVDVTLALSGGKILVTDGSGGSASNLIIEDVTGHAAADLGIAADTEEAAITGQTIHRVETLGDVIRAISYAAGNDGALTAAISDDGKGFVITDNTVGLGVSSVQALNDSGALEDLGLTGGFDGNQASSRHLIAGLNTVLLDSLNGGSGVRAGAIDFTRKAGDAFSLDFSEASTLADVIDIINADGRLTASINDGGTGILITDDSTGTGTFSAAGDMADDLNLSLDRRGDLASGNLNLQYVSETTRLVELNHGQGIDYGRIRLTNSQGISKTITLAEKSHQTVGDVIDAINRLNIGVTASINATGDGISLVDSAGGTGTLTVTDDAGGSAAEDLGIRGTATEGVLDGSFARSIDIDADDTLDDLVQKINSSGAGVIASIINDGTGLSPYRLVLTSATGGSAGEIAFDTDSRLLSFNTLTEARDATVVIGDPNSPHSVVVRSSSNTLDGVVDGLTLNLHAASDTAVQINVGRDVEGIVTDVGTFVETFNDAMDRIDELTRYIPETEEKGILLGDSTLRIIQSRLYSTLSERLDDSGLAYRSLTQVGLTIGGGARLQFDEEQFRSAFEEDPEGVEKLFTLLEEDDDGNVTKLGLAARLDEVLDQITNRADGTLTLRSDLLDDRIELFTDQAADLQELLDFKEARLYAQFQAMERALADLQSQQSALSQISSLAATGL